MKRVGGKGEQCEQLGSMLFSNTLTNCKGRRRDIEGHTDRYPKEVYQKVVLSVSRNLSLARLDAMPSTPPILPSHTAPSLSPTVQEYTTDIGTGYSTSPTRTQGSYRLSNSGGISGQFEKSGNGSSYGEKGSEGNANVSLISRRCAALAIALLLVSSALRSC
jgi:hypothetical protein